MRQNRRDGHGLPERNNADGGGNPLHRDTEETVQADADDVEIGKEQGMKDRREETIEKIVKKVVEMSDEEFQKFLKFLETV